MKGVASVSQIVGSVIAIVVAVSMIVVINTSVSDANLTGTQKTLATLIGIVFIAGIIITAVKAFM
jgi:hypothetical protein